MTDTVLFEGEQLYQLIPQREPIVMVSHVYQVTDTDIESGLLVKQDNMFCANGCLTEPGLIEHIAQSAAAFAGYPFFVAGKQAPLGYIGEIKKLRIHALPAVGSQLRTRIHLVSEVMGISLITAETTVNDTPIVTCQMKIFINE
ncbi:MAG: hydroxymyristoyl-ACP dehydratase [Paludibacteraceae bacterium]|nr:hydroxymyristoyl-ACP dehydratase [Paludibacteraceae bacterium]